MSDEEGGETAPVDDRASVAVVQEGEAVGEDVGAEMAEGAEEGEAAEEGDKGEEEGGELEGEGEGEFEGGQAEGEEMEGEEAEGVSEVPIEESFRPEAQPEVAQEAELELGPGQMELSDAELKELGITKSSLTKLESMEELRKSMDEAALAEAKKKEAVKKKMTALGSIISIRRGEGGFFDRSKIPRYMNTYRLDSDKPFNSETVEKILKSVLTEALEELKYDPDKVPKQCKWASSAIRAKVKEQEYDRYKIICVVTIGEKLCQDTYTMFRFLWDAERDRYAKVVHENMHLYAIGMCFGLYYE